MYTLASMIARAVTSAAPVRIGNLWMVVVRALDQEPLILKPFERGLSGHDGAGKRRMSGLGRQRADQPLPALKLGVLCLRLHRILHLCDRVPET
jgi:hypothetical protein